MTLHGAKRAFAAAAVCAALLLAPSELGKDPAASREVLRDAPAPARSSPGQGAGKLGSALHASFNKLPALPPHGLGWGQALQPVEGLAQRLQAREAGPASWERRKAAEGN